MTVLIDKPEVDRIDAALLVEELTEIYITPTPKALREAEKVKTDFDWCVLCYNSRGFIFIPWADKSPKRTWLDKKKYQDI